MEADVAVDRAIWKEKIMTATKDAGTYKPFFESVIDTLSGILEARDRALEQYEKSGAEPTVIHVNKAKEKNIAKNPMLTIVIDLNAQALAYWRDLGLTPKGLKSINEEGLKESNQTALEMALMNFES